MSRLRMGLEDEDGVSDAGGVDDGVPLDEGNVERDLEAIALTGWPIVGERYAPRASMANMLAKSVARFVRWP